MQYCPHSQALAVAQQCDAKRQLDGEHQSQRFELGLTAHWQCRVAPTPTLRQGGALGLCAVLPTRPPQLIGTTGGAALALLAQGGSTRALVDSVRDVAVAVDGTAVLMATLSGEQATRLSLYRSAIETL